MSNPTDIAIISSVSALSGVIISQAFSLFLSSLDKKHQRKILLRQKYEEMAFYFVDSLSWTGALGSAKTLDDILLKAYSPHAQKVRALCLLYFPGLVDVVNQYVNSQAKYFEFVATSFDKTDPFNAGGQALIHKKGADLMDTLVNNKNNLEDLIVSKVAQYIKA